MNKEQLEKLSDFELSARILKLKNSRFIICAPFPTTSSESQAAVEVESGFGAGMRVINFDINNWSDMGPLIEECKISISPIQPYIDNHDKEFWCASAEIVDANVEVWHKNPLRAAAIVYLLMQEDRK